MMFLCVDFKAVILNVIVILFCLSQIRDFHLIRFDKHYLIHSCVVVSLVLTFGKFTFLSPRLTKRASWEGSRPLNFRNVSAEGLELPIDKKVSRNLCVTALTSGLAKILSPELCASSMAENASAANMSDQMSEYMPEEPLLAINSLNIGTND